ncbi:MAG TPA: hypothetical protein VHW23_13175, partial [Kofleriaceae bacterium]|nr:hypothetical protein [Kofleriaceae bacterium]
MSLDPRNLVAVSDAPVVACRLRTLRSARICTGERWRHTQFRETRTLRSHCGDDTISSRAMLPHDPAAIRRMPIDAAIAAPAPGPSHAAAIEVVESDE